MAVFDKCNFLLGQGSAIVIVIPAHLPEAETYTIAITSDHLNFKAGHESIAEMAYQGEEIYKRLADCTQVGIMEYPPGEDFPPCITNVAYIEVRRAL